MAKPLLRLAAGITIIALWAQSLPGASRDLRVGVAGHAFDHVGAIGDQAEAALASGASIIYVSGMGGPGYLGLTSVDAMARQRQAATTYLRNAKRQGIRLAIGYVCATSIVKLETFDQNWPAEFRARFHLPPSGWRQQDRQRQARCPRGMAGITNRPA